eukprot:247672-Pyramimonas_sp.AAC.1
MSRAQSCPVSTSYTSDPLTRPLGGCWRGPDGYPVHASPKPAPLPTGQARTAGCAQGTASYSLPTNP